MINQIPKEVAKLLDRLAIGCQKILSDTFVGFYVHGSLTMGCFNFEQSDIDFLVVVNEPLDRHTKRALADILIQLSDEAPPKGFEMSIVLENNMQNFIYPTPFELHFGDNQIEKYKADPNYLCENGEDPDLAAHAMITKERGLCLLGKPISEVFLNIPTKYYLNSIIHDSRWSFDNISKGPDSGTCSVPMYGVLNFCRVLAFTNNGLITSKHEGGQWGLKNLPKEYSELIQQALSKYSGGKNVQEVEASTLKKFAIYAINRLGS